MSEPTLLQLSGLPRSGSTLLASMLSQHPDIHVEGTSALCDLLNGVCGVCDTPSLGYDNLHASGRYKEVKRKSVQSIYSSYYGDVQKKFVLDRSRGWSHINNLDIVRDYVNPNPKTIVLIRPIDEIVSSFSALLLRAGEDHNIYDELLESNTVPIMVPYNFVRIAAFSRDPAYLFLTYKELVENTTETLDKVFYHFGLPPAEIDFGHLSNFSVEDESVYRYENLHTLRDGISYRKNPIILPQHVKDQCEKLTVELFMDLPSSGATTDNEEIA
tara:strand:+ start:115 stop:930 length:816 start_codon:yes stop_codon:yes gene_type:complete